MAVLLRLGLVLPSNVLCLSVILVKSSSYTTSVVFCGVLWSSSLLRASLTACSMLSCCYTVSEGPFMSENRAATSSSVVISDWYKIGKYRWSAWATVVKFVYFELLKCSAASLSNVLRTRRNCWSIFRFSSTAARNASISRVKLYCLCWIFFRSTLTRCMICISTSSSNW